MEQKSSSFVQTMNQFKMNVSLMILTIFLVVQCNLDMKCACLQSSCAMTHVVYINCESMKKSSSIYVICNLSNAMSETDLVDEDVKLNFSIPNNININAFSNYSD